MIYKSFEMSLLAKQICTHLLKSWVVPDIYCTRTGATIIGERDIKGAVEKYGDHASGPRYSAFGFAYVLMRPGAECTQRRVNVFTVGDQRLVGVAFNDKEIMVPEDVCQELCL